MSCGIAIADTKWCWNRSSTAVSIFSILRVFSSINWREVLSRRAILAPVPAERVVMIGNAALQGAREVLLSRSTREALERQVHTIEHIELETTPDFFDVFVDGCQFKPIEFS